MQHEYNIQVESHPSPADEAHIFAALTAYNTQFVPPDRYQALAVFARTADWQLVGGLIGATYWGWLYISLLWIEEAHRGQRLGHRLLQSAEMEAVRRGCHHVHLDTLDFQAPGFYEKHGYTRFGELADLPPGYHRLYYQKRLAQVRQDEHVLGVDGCRAGWFYVRLGPGMADCGLVTAVTDLLAITPGADRILIDMPIGLVNGPEPRLCDRLARQALGVRRTSVFTPPCQTAVTAPTYAAANTENKRITGKGLSKQAWHLAPKIRELDDLLHHSAEARTLFQESHPELCFWALNGRSPMQHSKKTAAGQAERLALLQSLCPETAMLYETAVRRYPRRQLAPDDILDALVLVLATQRPLASFPPIPPTTANSLPMQIVYPL